MTRPVSGTQRRLAAIFCADVAGYSRLMGADERGTLRLLSSHREITDRQIEQYGGRIANTAGDSILAEFSSVVDAIQCAMAIQERIAAANQEVAEERRVAFRIGVHVGEVIVRDGDLFGDGVNIAARLQSLAPPGSVCVSGGAHEYVHRVLPLSFEDLGLQSVKNLDIPVRAYLTRPSGEPVSMALSPVHRHHEFYLARHFNAICFSALTEVAKREGLKAIDCPVLAAIADAPGITRCQLAERAAIDFAAAAQSVKRLEQRGLLTRRLNMDKQHSHGLHLTPTGYEVRMRIRLAFIATQDRVMAALSDHERETLKELLRRVIKANAARSSDQ
jgi:adenylate cyclase